MDADPQQPLLIADAARVLRVNEDTVRGFANSGALPVERTPGGLRIFRRGDVERLAAERAKRRVEERAR